mmetsp:Transcript_118715/g.329939  ORF Transcript_118715/g.329939 Transcript_118715/m.329939 type:complete len:254 (-) Transcript_118715:3123-3884(-)
MRSCSACRPRRCGTGWAPASARLAHANPMPPTCPRLRRWSPSHEPVRPGTRWQRLRRPRAVRAAAAPLRRRRAHHRAHPPPAPRASGAEPARRHSRAGRCLPRPAGPRAGPRRRRQPDRHPAGQRRRLRACACGAAAAPRGRPARRRCAPPGACQRAGRGRAGPVALSAQQGGRRGRAAGGHTDQRTRPDRAAPLPRRRCRRPQRQPVRRAAGELPADAAGRRQCAAATRLGAGPRAGAGRGACAPRGHRPDL